MKKLIFAVAALLAAPVVASEPADLNQLGLGSLATVSEEAGLEVRGLSANANAISVSSLALLFHDQGTGSQFNFESASLNFSDADGTVMEDVTAGAEAAAGNTAITFAVEGFSASLSQSALFSGGQSGGNGPFSFTLNVPSFN